jgi:hypothetical protein
MFDKTITLTSTDGTVTVSIVAGTEGIKSILLTCLVAAPKRVTPQQLIDIVAPAIKEWVGGLS